MARGDPPSGSAPPGPTPPGPAQTGSAQPEPTQPEPTQPGPATATRRGRFRGSTRRRRAVALATAALLAALVLGGLTARWFVWPSAAVGEPAAADAVVMFAGSGPRRAEAAGLAEAGLAPWLVVSDPRAPGLVWTAHGAFCQDEHRYHTVCFDPEPDTTRGEARFVADLARRQGWTRIVLVTDTEQARRAQELLARCWDGDVDVATVSSGRRRPLRIAYEWAAMLRAAVTRRGC